MATALSSITSFDYSSAAADTFAAAAGQRIAVRQWHKRGDRSAIQYWPMPVNPFHRLWSDAKPCTAPRLSFAVEHLADHRLIGRITLREINEFDARLGIYLIEPYCGSGLGTEAMLLFGRIYFEQFLFNVLKLDVAAANEQARRLYHRLGFRNIGQEWRDVSHDPALALLALPEYQAQRVYYRQSDNGQWQARFCEYEISRDEWPVQFDQVRHASA